MPVTYHDLAFPDDSDGGVVDLLVLFVPEPVLVPLLHRRHSDHEQQRQDAGEWRHRTVYGALCMQGRG